MFCVLDSLRLSTYVFTIVVSFVGLYLFSLYFLLSLRVLFLNVFDIGMATAVSFDNLLLYLLSCR